MSRTGNSRVLITFTICLILLPAAAGYNVLRADDVQFDFNRPSSAFLGDSESMVEFDANKIRQKPVTICGLSDGRYVSGEGIGGKDLAPWAIAGDYMYASEVSNRRIYRRSVSNYEQSNWECTNNTVVSIRSIWGLKDGSILVAVSGSPYKIYYSDDSGQTLAEKLQLSEKATVNIFSFHQASNGTGILAEYGSPPDNAGRYLYRWDPNDKTFTMVYDAIPDGNIYHFHAVCKQEALNRWIADAGDDIYRRFVCSDDDGYTWRKFTNADQTDEQPIAFMDYGDPNKILFGSDEHWMFGTMDISGQTVNNSDIEQLIFTWSRKASMNYCTGIFCYDGVYYAANLVKYYYPKDAVIMVSKDLKNWAVYHQFQDYEVGVHFFVGVAGGKLHCTVLTYSEAMKHFEISPVSDIKTTDAVILEPAVNNLLNSPASSSAEEPGAAWVGSVVSGRDSNYSHHGQWSFKLSCQPGITGIQARGPSVSVTPGHRYIGRLWIRAENCLNVHCEYAIGTSLSQAGDMAWCHPSPHYWQELLLNPFTMPADQNQLSIRLTAQGTVDMQIYIDSLQITEVPTSSWQIGSAPRSEEELEFTSQVVGDWTNTFVFFPDTSAEFFMRPLTVPQDKFFIKSWKVANTCAELYYKPFGNSLLATGSFILSVTDGNDSVSVQSKSRYFQRNGQIKCAVVCQGTGGAAALKLYISGGTPTEVLSLPSTEIAAGLCGGPLTGVYGDRNGSKLLPAAFADDCLYSRALDAEQINRIFSHSELQILYPNGGEVLVGGRMTEVLWHSLAGPQNVSIEYSTDAGQNWAPVGTVENNGMYQWVPPAQDSSQCLLRISDVNDGLIYDVTDGPFTLYSSGIPGDIDEDNDVDFKDLAILALYWMEQSCQPPASCHAADIYQDGKIDFSDLAILAENWLRSLE